MSCLKLFGALIMEDLGPQEFETVNVLVKI